MAFDTRMMDRARASGGVADDAEDPMARLRGGAPATGRSVSALARWSENSRCPTNNAAYAARVDLDRLLQGTPWEAEFGQSPDAMARGQRVEQLARRDRYARTFELVQEHLGFSVDEVRPLDLRHGYARNKDGLATRAALTAENLAASLRGDPDAPNVIDGAVLEATIGGSHAHLEADAIGAKAGPEHFEIEVKGWAVVDGKAMDAGGLGSAVRQMGIYRLLQMDLVERLGHDPDVVASRGLLITPKNVGLTLVATAIDLERATKVAETTLGHLPGVVALAGDIAGEVSFGPAAPASGEAEQRGEHLDALMDAVGTRYADSCMGSCGLAKFCRRRAATSASPSLAGAVAVRLLPGVPNLRRAADLAEGAAPSEAEQQTGAAEMLATAGALYRQRAALKPAAS